ncbi:MAG: secondary thiamine-phosphate synthase enzyme YjbQ [Burkholderiales bacterium]
METISIRTNKRCEFIDITRDVQACVAKSGIKSGVACIFIPHTTAGVAINENADPDVKRDVLFALERMVPNSGFAHCEGNSDAHTKAVLTGSSVSVIVEDSRLCLGTWQSIYFCEYDGPRNRKAYVKVTGER